MRRAEQAPRDLRYADPLLQDLLVAEMLGMVLRVRVATLFP